MAGGRRSRLDRPPLAARIDEGPEPPRRGRAASRVAAGSAVDHAEAQASRGPSEIGDVGHSLTVPWR